MKIIGYIFRYIRTIDSQSCVDYCIAFYENTEKGSKASLNIWAENVRQSGSQRFGLFALFSTSPSP